MVKCYQFTSIEHMAGRQFPQIIYQKHIRRVSRRNRAQRNSHHSDCDDAGENDAVDPVCRQDGYEDQSQQGDEYGRFLEIPHSDSIGKDADARIFKSQAGNVKTDCRPDGHLYVLGYGFDNQIPYPENPGWTTSTQAMVMKVAIPATASSETPAVSSSSPSRTLVPRVRAVPESA